MTAREYQELLKQARQMDHKKQLKLLADLASSIRRPANRTRRRSIMELRGKGKAAWKGVNAQKYVDRVRDEWNG